MLQRIAWSFPDGLELSCSFNFVLPGIVAGELFRMPREDIERLPREPVEVRLVLVVRRHRRLFEEVVEGAPKLRDRLVDAVGADGDVVFLCIGFEIHVVAGDY